MNLGKKLSTSLSKLVNIAIDTATESLLPMRHGAVLFASKKHILSASCNESGNRVCGFDVPSLHAEANCLRPIYNRAGRFGCRYQGRGQKKCREKGPSLRQIQRFSC